MRLESDEDSHSDSPLPGYTRLTVYAPTQLLDQTKVRQGEEVMNECIKMRRWARDKKKVIHLHSICTQSGRLAANNSGPWCKQNIVQI